MPTELKSREEFEKLLPSATEIRIVRGRGSSSKDDSTEGGDEKGATPQTKIKIRTGNRLYTFKTTEDDVQALVKGTKATVVEY